MSDLLQSLCSLLTVLQDHIKFIHENVLYVEVIYTILLDFVLFRSHVLILKGLPFNPLMRR